MAGEALKNWTNSNLYPSRPAPSTPAGAISDEFMAIQREGLSGAVAQASRIFADGHVRVLHMMLPAIAQVSDVWRRLYSTSQHGTSLSTLARCLEVQG